MTTATANAADRLRDLAAELEAEQDRPLLAATGNLTKYFEIDDRLRIKPDGDGQWRVWGLSPGGDGFNGEIDEDVAWRTEEFDIVNSTDVL